MGDDIDQRNIISRLVLLLLHYPKLRWVGRRPVGQLLVAVGGGYPWCRC